MKTNINAKIKHFALALISISSCALAGNTYEEASQTRITSETRNQVEATAHSFNEFSYENGSRENSHYINDRQYRIGMMKEYVLDEGRKEAFEKTTFKGFDPKSGPFMKSESWKGLDDHRDERFVIKQK
jgi:hypothetical protein